MAEYIKREAVLKALEKSLAFCENELDIGEYRTGCIAAIKDDIASVKHIPAADVVPNSEATKMKCGATGLECTYKANERGEYPCKECEHGREWQNQPILNDDI